MTYLAHDAAEGTKIFTVFLYGHKKWFRTPRGAGVVSFDTVKRLNW